MGTPVNVTRQANPGPLYAGRFPPAPPVAAPVAEFIGSPTSGTAPFTVTFTDQSTGSISSWAWDFGDGSSSSSQNPTHNFAAAGSYTVALTATGPGGSNTRTRTAYVSASAPVTPGTFPSVPTTGLVTLTLTPETTGTHAFAFGHAFAQGDIPSGSGLDGLQLNVQTTWPDGSAKFAIVSGGCAMTADTARTVGIAIGTAPTGTSITTSVLSAVTASVGAGVFGSASFGSTEWASPFATVASGPLMSSWLYRKAIGSDAHLVAWLEVRAWTDGSVEVLPWIENGYLRVASPTNKSATYTFTLGGTSRFSAAIDLKHHTRTPLVSGSVLSHWMGTDPGVVPVHDAAYLQTTELVPSYRASVPAGSALVTALPTTYTPLQAGSFLYDGGASSMAASGYQPAIGLLPEADVLHLVADETDRATTYGAVVRNGYSAGRYGIHYRDEATNLPAAFSDWPTLLISGIHIKDSGASTDSTYTPATSGGDPPLWDTAHCPSVGFMAYLLTGRRYFMEEVQFAATAIHFSVTDWARGGGTSGSPASGYTGASGIVSGFVQLRAGAWWMRSLAQALCVTPTTDSLHAEFKASVQNTVDWHHARYVAQANNPFGFVRPDVDYGTTGVFFSSPWMQDFYTAAFGYAQAMALPLDSTQATRLSQFFAWTAESAIGRLGTSSSPDWWYINAAPYTIAVAPSDTPDWVTGAGPWYADWQAMYAATYSTPPAWLGSTEGTLAAEYFPEDGTSGHPPSTFSNLQPAIAYAVRHGVSGAVDAYNRMAGASNWSDFTAGGATKPVWQVQPASGLYPAWRENAVLNEWLEITGTGGAGGAAINTGVSQMGAYNGMTVKQSTTEIIIALAGGHGDSFDNRVVKIGLSADAPSWTTLQASSATPRTGTTAVPYYADGKPVSRHTRHATQYLSATDKVYAVGASSLYDVANTADKVDAFRLSDNKWDGVVDDAPGTSGSGYSNTPAWGNFGQCVDSNGEIWLWYGTGRYNPQTDTYTQYTGAGAVTVASEPWACDTSRDMLFHICYGDGFTGGGPLYAARQPITGNAAREAITFSVGSASAVAQFGTDNVFDHALEYCPDTDKFYVYKGITGQLGRVYVITPNASTVWDMEILTLGGGSATPPASGSTGALGRFKYISAYKGFALIPNGTGNIHFLRVV